MNPVPAALLCVLVAVSLPWFGQKKPPATAEAPGPWILGTIGVGKQPDGTIKTTALKGLAIKVGEHGEATVAYDLDLCRMAGAWTGGFTTPMDLMSRGEYPTAVGAVAFTTGEVPGFQAGGGRFPVGNEQSNQINQRSDQKKDQSFSEKDSSDEGKERSEAEKDSSKARKKRSESEKGSAEVGKERSDSAKDSSDLGKQRSDPKMDSTEAGKERSAPASGQSEPGKERSDSKTDRSKSGSDGTNPWRDPRPEPFGPLPPGQARFRGFYVNGHKTILKWDLGGVEVLEMPEWRDGKFIRIIEGAAEPVAIPGVAVAKTDRLRTLTHGGPARWPESVVTTGDLSKDTASAYVVDTIKLPDPNPWGAPMFIGGVDFFGPVPEGAGPSAPGTPPSARPGGDGAPPSGFHAEAAVCTFHGDVFLVSGLDAGLGKVTWKRFATGLYHALGLRIVNGEIYVTCRDGLWRLKDLNGDGEADFYEAFNFDVKVTKSFHEFVFDLQTDPAGNFYFAKAGPVKNGGRGFDQIMAHHGSLFRVSPDGGKFEVIATGFRAPNGLGMGPHGELTSGDNEGTWTPVCKINWIQPGGFYGVVPLAHRDPLPTDYDRPLCWLPKRVDNSGGGQVWAPEGERWGPWGGRMLHVSYGQAALYGVLAEQVAPEGAAPSAPAPSKGGDGAPRSDRQSSTLHQGGVTKFPLQFQSGIMRARFSPADGQLYVAGLRGWQTSGLKNGCLQRVRYTGAETRMPIELHVKKDGLELRFTAALDTQTARDPENWHLEQWRYLWSAAYGSPELSTETDPETPAEPGKDGAAQFTKAQMGKSQHDSVSVKSVTIGTDDRTVFLEIPGLKPVMQMSIKYDLKTAEGKELRGDVVNTIHALGSE